MRSNQFSGTSDISSTRSRKTTSMQKYSDDLRPIAERLNDIIERSNQIDQQLSRIEELRGKNRHKKRRSPTSTSQTEQNNVLSPVALSQNSETPYSSSYKSTRNFSPTGSTNAYKQNIQNSKNFNFSPPTNLSYKLSTSAPTSTPSSAHSASPRSSPTSYAPSFSPNSSRRSGVVTLEQIFEAICQLRQEVAEISATQAEMKLEISRLKRGQK